MAMKIHSMIDDEVELSEFIDLFKSVNKIVKKED